MPDIFKVPYGKQTYSEVLREIKKLQDQGELLINVCWPNNATSIFMKKRMAKDLSGTFGIRNTTSTELLPLLLDSKGNLPKFNGPKNIDDYKNLYEVAQFLGFGDQAWSKIDLITETLKSVSNLNASQLNYLKNSCDLAFSCWEKFNELNSDHKQTNLRTDVDLKEVFGSCIIVSNAKLDENSRIINEEFGQIVSNNIVSAQLCNFESKIETDIFNDPFDEIAYSFDRLLKEYPSIDPIQFAFIVPNMQYKSQMVAVADAFGIPVTTNTGETLFDNIFAQLIAYIISNFRLQSNLVHEVTARFPNLFDFQDSKYSYSKLLTCLENLQGASSISNFLSPLTIFLESLIKTYNFSGDEEFREVEQILTLLEDLSKIDFNITPIDLIELIKKVLSARVRKNKIGEGCFIATPDEIIGCYFEHIFVLGLNDQYIKPKSRKSSFINRDVLSILGLDEETNQSTLINQLKTWLLSDTSSVTFSSTKVDFSGKTISLPVWTRPITHEKSFIFSRAIDNENEKSPFLADLLSISPSSLTTRYKGPIPQKISATAVETLACCPFKFLNKHVFKIKTQRDPLDSDLLEPIELGNQIHKVLETCVKNDLSKEETFNEVVQTAKTLLENDKFHNFSAVDVNQQIMFELVENYFKLDEESIYINREAETEVEGKVVLNDHEFSITGIIDRIDTDKNGRSTLIDYKTGKRQDKSSDDFFKRSRRFQLGIYAFLYATKLKIRSLEYWYLSSSEFKRDTLKISEAEIAECENRLKQILSVFESGLFPAREYIATGKTDKQKMEYQCDNCEFNKVCLKSHKAQWNKITSTEEYSKYLSATSGSK